METCPQSRLLVSGLEAEAKTKSLGVLGVRSGISGMSLSSQCWFIYVLIWGRKLVVAAWTEWEILRLLQMVPMGEYIDFLPHMDI